MCLLSGILTGGAAKAADGFQIKPIEKPEDLRLMPAEAWPHPESEPGEMLLKLSYLRGLIDALQYLEVAPRSASQTLKNCQGMSLQELAATIDRYYLADPRRRELPPAAVLFRILPLSTPGQPPKAPLAPGGVPGKSQEIPMPPVNAPGQNTP
jgi:hypothetical protein